MRFSSCLASAALICAVSIACGRTCPSGDTGRAHPAGSNVCDPYGAPGSTGGDSGAACEACDQPDPGLSDRFHPEQLATDLTIRSVQERSLEFFLADFMDQILAAGDGAILLSAGDGVYRFADTELTFVRAHARDDSLQNVIETLYPHSAGVFLIDYDDPNLAEAAGPKLPTETTIIDLSWDGAMSEVDAGQDRNPQGVVALGSDGYLLADGGIFPLRNVSDVVEGSQSSVWRRANTVHQGRIFRFGHPEGIATVQGLDPSGHLPPLSASPPPEMSTPWSITSCGDELLLQGNQLWSLNPETGETRVLDAGGRLTFLDGIGGDIPIAVSCNSWAAFWFTASAEPGNGALKMLRVGDDTPLTVAQGLDTRGILATEDDLYWLSPGDRVGALWRASLTELRP